MANKHQVIDLNRANPHWTARDIAEAIGCDSEYVRATGQRNGLKFAPALNRAPSSVARLRRCAPDLLDALCDARGFIAGYADVSDGAYGSSVPNAAMQLQAEIDAVIAKATGAGA